MSEVMQKLGGEGDLNALITKLMTEIIGKDIEKATQGIFPLQNVFIRKAKVVKAPKLDIGKLLEAHGGADEIAKLVAESGKKVDREGAGDEEKGAAKKKKAGKKKAAKEAGSDEDE